MAEPNPTRRCVVCKKSIEGKRKRNITCSHSCGKRTTRRSMDEVFWSKVATAPAPGCWEWQGSRDVYGYGRRGNPSIKAHRFSWELHNGPIPPEMNVLHHCDNPPCVNPSHLFLGTDTDNHRDRAAKGRNRDQRGERHNMAKLTVPDVLAIRAMTGIAQAKIGELFDIEQSTVSAIKRRKIWRHLDPMPNDGASAS